MSASFSSTLNDEGEETSLIFSSPATAIDLTIVAVGIFADLLLDLA
jgi:hypothetical protein